MVVGAILCRGLHTVTAVLRVMGLGGEGRFEKYPRVLSRACGSKLQGAKMLLGLVVVLLPAGWPLLRGVDETIERRGGRKIKAKGGYRDGVRSSQKSCVKCFGLKWISMRVIVPLPWSSRPWALPFLSVLAPAKRANEKAQKRHKTTIDWAVQMVKGVARWLAHRAWVLLGDGGYAWWGWPGPVLASRCPGCLGSVWMPASMSFHPLGWLAGGVPSLRKERSYPP